MTHLEILCEGETEHRVLKSFLRPYTQRFASVNVTHYSGNGELKRRFKGDTERQLTSEPDTYILCLIDLYEEPYHLYDPRTITIETGFILIQDFMIRQVDSRFHTRLGVFPVVMEIETWLLADPIVQQLIGENLVQPEAIPHPSAYLKSVYKAKNRSYNKIVDGLGLFNRADAKRVYEDNCPHFIRLIDWLQHPKPSTAAIVSQVIKRKSEMWEQQRDRLYAHFVELESAAYQSHNDDDLNFAIAAETEYYFWLQRYNEIFEEEN